MNELFKSKSIDKRIFIIGVPPEETGLSRAHSQKEEYKEGEWHWRLMPLKS